MGRHNDGSPLTLIPEGDKPVKLSISIFNREWSIVQKVMERYHLQVSQALRVIINEYEERTVSQDDPK